jgi:NADH-quinone oxidoreductase subunit N
MLLYLCVYAAATIGAFAALAHLGQKEEQLESLDELAGLAYTRPTLAAMLAVCMFSLAGIPPLAGFWGKLAIFGSALSVDVGPTATGAHRPWFIALAIIGALNAAVAAAYYLRVVGVLYFRVPTGKLAAAGGRGPWLAAVACTLLVITIGLYPGPLWRAAQQAQPSRRTHSPAARLEQQIMSGPRLPSATLTLPPCEGPRLRQQKGAYSSGCSLLLRSECSAGKLIVASSCKDPEGEPLSGLQGN